jgi:hypothetical protein
MISNGIIADRVIDVIYRVDSFDRDIYCTVDSFILMAVIEGWARALRAV